MNEKADVQALDIFKALIDPKDKPKIAHNELYYWVVIPVSCAMLFKLLALFWILRGWPW